jgi:hypothetical protein
MLGLVNFLFDQLGTVRSLADCALKTIAYHISIFCGPHNEDHDAIDQQEPAREGNVQMTGQGKAGQ